MAEEYTIDAERDFIDAMVLLLMKYGVPAQEAKSELYLQLRNVQIIPKCTDLVPYEGNVNEGLLKRFIVAKKIKGCTDKTLQAYYERITYALKAIGKPATQITAADVQCYIAIKMRAGVKKITLDGYRLALSSFYAWLQREGVVSENPMNRVDKIKFNPRKEEAFSDDEIERMRAQLYTWRETAIFEMLLSTGCRVSELVSIRREQIGDGEIEVLGKGEKFRTVYLNAKARLAVERYLAEREDGNPYLFPKSIFSVGNGEKGIAGAYVKKHGHGSAKAYANWYKDPELVDTEHAMSIDGVRAMVNRLGAAAGVDGVHPHRFRRTCATHALQRGMPLELVSKMLGHNKLDTTKIYLTLAEDDLRQAHKKYVN